MSGQFIRVIRRKEILALAFGAMIGWSWVALTGTWIETAGSIGAVLAFAAGGIVARAVGHREREPVRERGVALA